MVEKYKVLLVSVSRECVRLESPDNTVKYAIALPGPTLTWHCWKGIVLVWIIKMSLEVTGLATW